MNHNKMRAARELAAISIIIVISGVACWLRPEWFFMPEDIVAMQLLGKIYIPMGIIALFTASAIAQD